MLTTPMPTGIRRTRLTHSSYRWVLRYPTTRSASLGPVVTSVAWIGLPSSGWSSSCRGSTFWAFLCRGSFLCFFPSSCRMFLPLLPLACSPVCYSIYCSFHEDYTSKRSTLKLEFHHMKDGLEATISLRLISG